MSGVPKTAAGLLRELRTSPWLPQFNEAAVQKALDEIDQLVAENDGIASLDGYDEEDPSWATTMWAGAAIFNHARACLIAHATFRLSKIIELRWAAASALPAANRAMLSPAEVAFANDYDALLADYMTTAAKGLDLTNGVSPPKDLFIEIRVERSAGAVVLESGQPLQLVAHERHLLRRSDAEPLIRKGLVEHCMPGC